MSIIAIVMVVVEVVKANVIAKNKKISKVLKRIIIKMPSRALTIVVIIVVEVVVVADVDVVVFDVRGNIVVRELVILRSKKKSTKSFKPALNKSHGLVFDFLSGSLPAL